MGETSTTRVAVARAPLLSLSVTVTVKFCEVEKAWDAEAPVACAPSPKLQANPPNPPDPFPPVARNVMFVPGAAAELVSVALAVGTGLTSMVTGALSVVPVPSTTKQLADTVPGAAYASATVAPESS